MIFVAKFRFAYNRSVPARQPREYPIATGTVIEKGEVVMLSSGRVVAVGDTDQDDPYLGVAAEAHDGATADGRQTGLVIQVYDHPDDVFALIPTSVITATGGSTTSFVVDGLKAATISSNYDDMLNGGKIKIVSCAADSSLNGKYVDISDFNSANGTITLAETLPVAMAAGDTAYLCPGVLSIGNKAYNLTADGTDVAFEDTSAGDCLQLVDVAPQTFTTFFKLRLHQNSAQPTAIP